MADNAAASRHHIDGRNLLSELVEQICRLRTIVSAICMAARQDEPSTLYWPDLIEIIQDMLPDEDKIDATFSRVFKNYEALLREAEEAAGDAEPKATAKSPRKRRAATPAPTT